MPLNIQIPTVGLADATEEPKITNNANALSAWANGNIADSDLQSPNNSVRRLVLQSEAILDDTTPTGDTIFTSGAYPVVSGAATYYPPPIWIGDSGVSSQPPGFQVPNKNAVARIRTALAVTLAVPSGTITPGLYQITGIGANARAVAYTFGTAYAGSTVSASNPAAGIVSLETPQFYLPGSIAVYALGVNLSNPLPAGCAIAVTAQLYAYSA